MRSGSLFLSVAVLAFLTAAPSVGYARQWFVAPGGTGDGSMSAPFGSVQVGLDAAQPGDTVVLAPGTYTESIHTLRGGLRDEPIRLQASAPRTAIVTFAGRVLRVDHPYLVVDGLVLDGQYGMADTVTVSSGAQGLVLRNSEIRRSSRDLIDMAGPVGVLIEGCLVHHALNAAGGRTDAHGIAAGAVQDLTIRDTDIHTFSGDGLQVDPGRGAPGWRNVIVERSRIWLAPLPAPENGFAAGVVPGENAIDTKAASGLPRSRMTIRDTEAWGFRDGLISNMAAFNIKENVDVTLDRVTVRDSEIAFRLRGHTSATAAGAWVTIMNAVVYRTGTAFRYENNIDPLRIWNSTVGKDVARVFHAASSTPVGLNVRNLLILGNRPAEASHPSNLAVDASAFVNAAGNDYRLSAGSPAVDAGVALQDVTVDRLGVGRPQRSRFDVGAYELPSR